jgi:hypothetical protein
MMSFHARRNLTAVPFVALLAMPLAGQTACPDPVTLTAGVEGPMAHVRYLSDDALGGREVGSQGARCAADYLADRFTDLGLEPAGNYRSFYHTFTIRNGSELGEGNTLTIAGQPLAVGTDWMPAGYAAHSEVEGELVFAGTGLSSPGNPGDRFTQIDVTDKIMVVEWGDPDGAHGQSMRADPHFKATVAAGRDAAALLVLMPEGSEMLRPDREIRNTLAIPVAVVAAEAVPQMRAAAEAGAIATLATEVNPTTADVRNVAAVRPGSDPMLRDEYVVVGAHFDHLGWGGDGSLSPDERAVHNGADDNASGTAGLLEIARLMAEGPRPQRSVLFLGFNGEEKGLWGSARYVAEPTVSIESMVAMLNLDMVGRLATGDLTIFGVGTAEEMEDLISTANASLTDPLEYGTSPDGYGASDHASFYEAGVPVLHFFTNTHQDYHRPSDDWDKIDGDGIERVAELAAGVASLLAGSASRTAAAVTPILVDRPAPASQSSRGSGAGLGTIPDMTPRDFGMRITGVREGSAADKAGMQAGDVIVEFDGKEITDIYAFTYALQARAPGDEVVVVVERDGERLTLTAVLGAR